MPFEVITAVNMSIILLRVVTPCGSVDGYHRFGTYHIQDEDGGDTILRNAGIATHKIAQRYNPDNYDRHVHSRYNLKHAWRFVALFTGSGT